MLLGKSGNPGSRILPISTQVSRQTHYRQDIACLASPINCVEPSSSLQEPPKPASEGLLACCDAFSEGRVEERLEFFISTCTHESCNEAATGGSCNDSRK